MAPGLASAMSARCAMNARAVVSGAKVRRSPAPRGGSRRFGGRSAIVPRASVDEPEADGKPFDPTTTNEDAAPIHQGQWRPISRWRRPRPGEAQRPVGLPRPRHPRPHQPPRRDRRVERVHRGRRRRARRHQRARDDPPGPRVALPRRRVRRPRRPPRRPRHGPQLGARRRRAGRDGQRDEPRRGARQTQRIPHRARKVPARRGAE